MTQPPLTLALSLVLTARVENAGRRALLASMHPEFGRATAAGRETPADPAQSEPDPRAA